MALILLMYAHLFLTRKTNIQIKTELDSLERNKDEESKKFKSHNIEFDFYILIKIKEAMVDVSSNCMELALKVTQHSQTNTLFSFDDSTLG